MAVKKERIPILLFALTCLLAGIWSGLTRMGWTLTALPIAPHHGAIMVGGFLGTLIALEKIIPINKKYLYAIPVLNALSVVFFFAGYPNVSAWILVFSSASLFFVFLYYFRTQRSLIYVLMLIGSACWFVGNVLLLTKWFYPLAFPWWLAFALFIITAERLEVMKFLPVTKLDKTILVGLLILFAAGVVVSFHGMGNLFCGSSLVGIALWLLRYDMIAINWKKHGIQKFVAIALLLGYTSLLLTGVFFLSLSDQWLTYDAIVHSFFIGFVFSMIFAHGPMILPGVMGISITPFSRSLYVWLTILHASWLMRIAGDILLEMDARKISGLLSGLAIIGYFITMAIISFRNHRYATAV